MDTFGLKIIASDGVFYEGRCKKLIIPAPDGEKGILANHENMVIAVNVGVAHMSLDGEEWKDIAVGVGFVEIVNNRVTLIVDTAEKPEDIDVRRAQEQKERAEERLRQQQSIQQYYHTQASLARAMNRLRVNIKFCGKNTKKILVISSVPNEGKSSVSVQLWKMLAEAGFPSVLVDVDLRKSMLKSRHNFSYEGELKGLDYYLSGLAEYQDVIYKTNIENGYIVPCSNLLENPSALLEDPRMKEMLDHLAEDYRYVIIDSPPLDSVSDGLLIGAMCDGAILVVRSGMTSRTLIKHSLQQLERIQCKLLGTVLNRVETTSRAYSKYYGKYGKYYQDSYGPETSSGK